MVAGFKELKARLDKHGFRPRRGLGQNFLLDPNLLGFIADALPLDRDSVVLEIGAGAGGLTRELARRAGRIIAVEIDARLVAFLEEELRRWGTDRERVELLHGDALGPDGLSADCQAGLARATAGGSGYVCVSNLPYAASGPLLAALSQSALSPENGLCLCQWELAARILAEPASPGYGTLSVLLALAFAPRLLRRVPPEVFRPRPRVDSALVSLGPARSFLERPASERSAFGRFLMGLFGGRRKVLCNALKRVWKLEPGRIFDQEDLPAAWLGSRPEELGPESLLRIFEAERVMQAGGDQP
ncbi:MAG: 16S rRNA (adenine(1518)-N(6)/adenine(1519)-N(6))-dimethyltransferase RsmA [Planctomycetota bacterium]